MPVPIIGFRLFSLFPYVSCPLLLVRDLASIIWWGRAKGEEIALWLCQALPSIILDMFSYPVTPPSYNHILTAAATPPQQVLPAPHPVSTSVSGSSGRWELPTPSGL